MRTAPQTPTILVTGTAGFIGYHVSMQLPQSGHRVIGIDNLNDYYDVRVKQYRLDQLKHRDGFTFLEKDIENHKTLSQQ
jgi:UDP-glucuronate 4-epimerase